MVTEEAKLLSYEEALRLVLENTVPLGSEEVALGELLGRVLAMPIAARTDLPPFDNSAVDGFAFHVTDVQEGLRWRQFRVVGESKAGSKSLPTLNSGEALRVFTGAPLPPEVGAVAMQEICPVDDGHVKVDDVVDPEDHIRRRGSEAHFGSVVVPPILVTPPVIAALSAAGHDRALVFKRPQVGILVTGDELAVPGSELLPGQVYESNGAAIRAAVLALGLPEPKLLRCADSAQDTRTALTSLTESCDVVITSGGVSVGLHDVVRPTLEALGVQQIFWGVAIKPGKPIYFGKKGQIAIFGLPGNPVSALVTFALFVQPFLRRTSGRAVPTQPRQMVLRQSLTKRLGRAEFVPCRIAADGAHPVVGRASHKASCLAEADGLAILGAERESVLEGEQVDVIELTWGWEA